ncbi:MAG: TetR/AcrR family transcriptional regulator [Gammaproteobacteria bacterium]|nr:MAG: TetR/AcrR family transcriptional regulator [Gammaproteobacteria bacterium]
MATKSARDKIVDTALALAEQRSWEAVRLHDVAAELGITLDGVRAHFREKEDIVDAWFDRADRAMLEDAAKPDFLSLAPRGRLQRVIMAWLSALAPHRRPARQMICNKFEPGHIHYQFSGLLRVSRTVQWMREAAHRDATLPWRAFEETTLTCVYLMTFFYWMRDGSEGSNRTATFLDQLLGRAERLAHAIPGCRKTPERTAKPAHPSAGSKAAPPA